MKIRLAIFGLVGCLLLLASWPALAANGGIDVEPSVYLAAADTDHDSFADDFDADFGDFNSESTVSQRNERLIADPLQPLNRGVFWLNDKLYFYAFKPIAKGYRFVVPRPARVSVGNFFSNLATPIRAGNALLQFKFRDFGTESYRFVVNTTIGVVGLFDPADSYLGVKKVTEDFGQTLGHYRVGHGFYLVLPIVGPSSLRDAGGVFVDSYLDPLRYANIKSIEYTGIKLFDAENRLSLDRDTYEGIVRDAIDPYLFIRAAYAQRRAAQIGDDTFNINLFEGPLFDSEFYNPFNWLGTLL